jgi:hypothetical protein
VNFANRKGSETQNIVKVTEGCWHCRTKEMAPFQGLKKIDISMARKPKLTIVE